MITQTIKEKVRQRRSQMLIHSYLYYWCDSPIISDDLWQTWADELVELQKECTNIGFYDEEFNGWDGSTGHHLPKDDWVISKANQVARFHVSMQEHLTNTKWKDYRGIARVVE